MPGIPETIYAGDSLSWTESAGEYPAPTWTMHYAIRGASILDLTSTPSGSDHAVHGDRCADGDTYARSILLAVLRHGRDGGAVHHRDRIALPSGRTSRHRIAGFDGRSHAQKVLDAIEATMEGRATKSQAIMQINNRQIQYLKPEELIKWRSFYKAEVAREKTAEKVAQGEDPGNRILTRFRDDASRGAWPLNRVWRWPW